MGLYRYEDIFGVTQNTHFRYLIETNATGYAQLVAHDQGGNEAS